MKKPWKIFLCMLISFGCSEKIIEDNETFLAEPNKTSENLTTFGYEISHFDDKNAEVRKFLSRYVFQRLKDFQSSPIQVILNSTEWEITVHLYDFDEFWMSYATGKGSDEIILNLHFQAILAVLRNDSEIFQNFENLQFLRHHIWLPK